MGDVEDELPPEGARASLWAWKGFLKTVFCFLGAEVGFVIGDTAAGTMGLIDRLTGTKFSSNTWTKFEGNNPTMRRSLRSRPIHHWPSPAFRHSIKSPSTNPKSRLLSPPHEYTARHQHGNRVGSCGAAGGITVSWGTLSACKNVAIALTLVSDDAKGKEGAYIAQLNRQGAGELCC
jgi:hypothetical protein